MHLLLGKQVQIPRCARNHNDFARVTPQNLTFTPADSRFVRGMSRRDTSDVLVRQRSMTTTSARTTQCACRLRECRATIIHGNAAHWHW